MNIKLDEKYLSEARSLFGEDFEAYLACFEKPSYVGLRVNTNKISVEEFKTLFPYDLTPIPWCENGFYVSGDAAVSKHPFYYAGLYYLQEPSAMLPAVVLDSQPDEIILDGCAAPGGKSTQLALGLNHTGLLISNDISASRAQGLLKNIERFGIENSYVISEDLVKLSQRFAGRFDKVLLDVPCSGQGMFRKDPSLIESYRLKDSSCYPELQKQLLKAGVELLKPGGKLVYSTCTFSVCENEEVLLSVLNERNDLHLLPIRKYPGFENGLLGLTECARLYPHRIEGEGHFVALLQKDGTGNADAVLPSRTLPALKHADLNRFMSHLRTSRFQGDLVRIEEKVLLLPEIPFANEGIRTLRSGLLMGTIKNERFIPSAVLALALKAEEFDQCVNLNVNDARVMRYLKGETLDLSDFSLSEGQVLICVENQPLGFGKWSSGGFKNEIDKGRRML